MNKSFQNIINQKDVLELLSKTKPRYIKSFINSADCNLIQAICELTNNLLLGNLEISEDIKNKLRKHKLRIRKLCLKSKLCEKKKILSQSGGFLNILIPAVLGGLTSILEHYILKPAIE